MRLFKNTYVQFLILCIILLFLPMMAKIGLIKSSYIVIIGTTLIYTIVALGMNVLLGYSGLISLGTAGFMGFAAYLSAYMTNQLQLPFELSFIISVLIPTVLGILVGMISLKIEGFYLAIATLAVAEIFREIFIQFDAFTGGSSGAIASYPVLMGFFKLNQTQMYYLIVIIMGLIFAGVYNLMKGHLGRALNAMRGSEAAAQAMGVNIYKYRLIAFGIATFLASVGGVLYVHFIRLSYPTMWTLPLSLDFLAIIIIGGFRSIYGTLLGAFIVFGFTEIFFKPIPFLADISPIFKGILMILFVMFYPGGAINIFYDIKRIFQKNKSTSVEVNK